MVRSTNANRTRRKKQRPRIFLTEMDLKRLFQINTSQSASSIAKRSGLPYMLVYNVIHGRVRSVSHRHYTLLFGGPPPPQAPIRIDGQRFREMVELWLFLNDGITRSALYRELFGLSPMEKVDHRILSGKINTIDGRLEHAMQQKFKVQGVEASLLDQWLTEFAALSPTERVPYSRLRSTLNYIEEKLGLHPTAVLNQSIVRYESGMLKSVSRKVADHAENLKQATEKALRRKGRPGVEKMRESILGSRKSGYTLYMDIRDELRFAVKNGKRGAKFYLGRSLWTYEKGKAKHIADWRASKIRETCNQIIRQHPEMALSSLPPSRRRIRVQRLLDVMMSRSARLLSQKAGLDFEKQILKPLHRREEYGNPHHGFTPFEMASRVLGMRRRAFDLMVTENCEIFRSVGRFSQRWYLSNLYLKELSGKKNFKLIMAKYEQMARHAHRPNSADACLA